MKSRNVLILALVMALVTTVLFNKYLKDLDKKYKKNDNKIAVIVPKTAIKKNQRVTKEMLQTKELSSDSVPADAIKKVQQLEGKYALTDIREGEVLLPFRFTSQFEESEEITRKIREGYRAVSIEVNFVESVSNLVQPENYVDIIFSEIIKEGGKNQVNTSLILENVRVLAVGKSLKESDEGNKDSKDSKGSSVTKAQGQESLYTAVTVELKPEDAVKIINADERGNVKFILKSKILQ